MLKNNFLSITLWLLDVAKVVMVSRIIMEKHISFFIFTFSPEETDYTSNESWNYVEFNFMTKNYDFIDEKKNSIILLGKNADQVSLQAIFSQFYKVNLQIDFMGGW